MRWIAIMFAVLLAAAPFGCARDVHSAEPIDGVAWVVVIEAGEGGEFLRASPLLPYDGSARSFEQHDDAKTVWIAGYSAEEIAALGTPTPDALFKGQGCDPALPPPRWQQKVFGDDPTVADLPKLTGNWLRDHCPVLEATDIDVRCAVSRCFAYTRQTGCEVAVDLEACGLPTVRGRLHPGGDLCLEPDDRCVAENEDHPTLTCTAPKNCEIHLYPNPAAPDWSVVETKAVPTATERSPIGDDGIGLHPILGYSGWFADFAVLDDRVFVATHAGRYQESRSCVDPSQMEARSFTLDTLQPIATSTLPPCTSKLERDPHGDGVIAFYAGQAWRTGRFDKEGRLLASEPVPLPDARVWHPSASVVDLERDRIWVVFSTYDGANAYSLLSVDAISLTGRFLDVTETETALSIALAPDGTLVIPDNERTSVRFYDPETESTKGYARPSALLGSVRFGSIAFIDGANTFLVPVPSDEPAIYLFRSPGVIEHRRGFWATRDFGPLHAIAWPANRDYALIGAATPNDRPPRETVLALYDGRSDTFVPGVLNAGFGAPTHLRSSDRAVYVGFNWDSRLMRIEPR